MIKYSKRVYVIDKKSRKILRKYIFFNRDNFIEWFNKNCIGKEYKSNPNIHYFIKVYTYYGDIKKGVQII